MRVTQMSDIRKYTDDFFRAVANPKNTHTHVSEPYLDTAGLGMWNSEHVKLICDFYCSKVQIHVNLLKVSNSYIPYTEHSLTILSFSCISGVVLTVCKPVFRKYDNKFLGVIGIDMTLSHFIKDTIDLGRSDSYAFVMEKRGSVILHPLLPVATIQSAG